MIDIDSSLEFPSSLLSKNISKGRWIPSQCCVEMVVIKGNYWRIMGYNMNQMNYLHPEEALYLYERNMLVIVNEDDVPYRKDIIYQMIINVISLPCYLCYTKLKMMDYIVKRFGRNVTNISLQSLQNTPISDSFFSYSVYGNSSSWSKKSSLITPAAGYVVVTDSQFAFPPSIVLSLLTLSHGIPILFAIMTNSGHVYLEEFTDALLSLDWSLPVGTPVPRKDPQQTHPECETEIIPQQQFRDDPVEEDLNFISQEDEEQIP